MSKISSRGIAAKAKRKNFHGVAHPASGILENVLKNINLRRN
jgi:hypothetical protein